jgi:AcrR family transcriptional regulator
MVRADPKHRLGPYRDPQIDAKVFAVTRRLLKERGYRGTSIDAIAEAAGVSRPTIYRRWPSKAHVINEALFPDNAPQIEPSADHVHEITGAIRNIIAFLGEPTAREALPGLMSDMRSDPTLQPKLAVRHTLVVSAGLRALLASNAGSLRQVDADTLLDVMVGAAIMALCIRDVTDLDTYAASLTDLLFNGILAH